MRRPREAAGSAAQLVRCLLALVAIGTASAQCSINFTVTLRNFNKAGAGPNGNPDFGFLPEPADISDKKIVLATIATDGPPQYRPATGFNTTTTHSKADFDQWFSANSAYQQDAIMTLDQTVVDAEQDFEFNSASFYPLNGQLLGASKPNANNQYFTMELRADLMYLQASQGVLSFSTNCDLFVFLNGELVVDLGGVHTQQSATLNLIRMGLQNAVTYPVAIFLAQRHAPPATPTLDFSTNVDFVSGRTTAQYCDAQGGGSDPGNNATGLDAQYPPVMPPPADGFPGVPGCNSVWGVAGNDSCSIIASKSGLANTAALLALNPGLDCGALGEGQLVCTGTGGVPTATCGNRVYSTQAGDSCLTVRNNFGTNGAPIKYAVLSALNPDVSCGPNGQSPLPAGTNLCLPQVPGATSSGRRRLQSMANDSGDIGVMAAAAGGDALDGGSFAGRLAGALQHRQLLQKGPTEGVAENVLQGHLPDLLHGFGAAAEDFRRTLKATTIAAGGTCIGASFTVAMTSCSVNCASAANQAGLTVTQLVLLNPQLFNNPTKTCKVSNGQTLCKGCTGTVCGIKISPALSDFLNFPNLNLLMCGLLADCGNTAYTAGVIGGQDEQLTVTMTQQSASTRAYTAAGGVQIAPFFAADGPAVTNPGSQLSVSIYPSYYNSVPTLTKGGVSAGLVSWVETVILPDNSTARVASTSAASAGDITPAAGRRLQAAGSPEAAVIGAAGGGVSPARRWLQPGRDVEAAGGGGVIEPDSLDEELFREGRRLQGFRLPSYRGHSRYRQSSRNPRTMVISRWRRIW